jgi:putative nucleotidyltransferase with HDIG domain/PAS domain S-box-containing protein
MHKDKRSAPDGGKNGLEYFERQVAEFFPQPIARYDRDCKRIYANPALLSIDSQTRAGFLGKTPLEYSPLISSPAAYVDKLRKVLETGQPDEMEIQLKGGEGTQWARVSFMPERGAGGEVLGVLVIGHDITQQMQAERRFRELVEGWPDEIARYDRHCRRAYVNPVMETTQAGSGPLLGRTPTETYPDSEAIAFYEGKLKEVLATGTVQEFDMDWTAPADHPRYRLLRLAPERDENGEIVGVFAIARDVTGLKQSELTLRRLNRALKTLSSGNETLIRANSEAELLERMCRVAVEVGGYRLAWIAYLEPDGSIQPMAWAGDEGDFRRLSGQGGDTSGAHDLVAKAVSSGSVQVGHDCGDRPDCRASLVLPLPDGRGLLGALVIYSSDADAFDADEVDLLKEMAQDLAYGIRTLRGRAEQEQFFQRLQASMESSILALTSTIEMRDPYTAGHQRRVAELAKAVAHELAWDEERVRALYLAGLVHDIGKIAIPAEILSKPGRLSMVELSLVRTHVDAGYNILKNIEFPWPIADIVHQHHERFDGSGYPLGLKGTSILPEARILAVCDVVEAMSMHRPYRPGLGLDAALAEVESGRGTAYDPACVDACCRLLREERFRFD